jgi:hypothetical protein
MPHNGQKSIWRAGAIGSRLIYNMSYSIATLPLDTVQEKILSGEFSCGEAQKACMPAFVFSTAGQVGFRNALEHLVECKRKDCISLRKKVRESMYDKLKWLFSEHVLLGCIGCQSFLYGIRQPLNLHDNKNFTLVASHLSQCQQEGCAKLRRAVLLTVRDSVSPSATSKDLF